MNTRRGAYGYGIRKRKDVKSRPYYGRVHFQGRRFDTRPYARMKEAAIARQILENALHLVAKMESQP